MARSRPILVYLKPSDKLKLQALATIRRMSQSLVLVESVQDAFAAAFGRTADPTKVIQQYGPMFVGQEVTTQRARRRSKTSSPGKNFAPTS